MASDDTNRIREHLDRLTASRGFADSDRLKRFLRFTVDAKLSEQPEKAKEFVIGREVFDRKEDYDPRLDPIVRVEARRLRSKLAEYYANQGRGERIRLDYPKGSYLPIFSTHRLSRIPLAIQRRRWFLAAGLLIVATIMLAYLVRPPAAADTMVAVLPASWLWPDETGISARDAAIAEALDNELANRQLVRVIAWPIVLQYRNRVVGLKPLAETLGVSNAIVVSVRIIGADDLVTAFFIDARTGEKQRALQFVRHNLATLQGQQSVARDIASGLR